MRNKYIYVSALLVFVVLATLIITKEVGAVSGGKIWGNDIWNTFLEQMPGGGPYLTSSDNRLLQFYPVEQWEIDVCTRGVTSMMNKPKKDTGTAVDSTRTSYTGIAVAISASKYTYVSINETVYNIEWYVLPQDAPIKYSIYLNTSKGQKYYIPDYNGTVADPYVSSSKSIASYYAENYTSVGIEYLVNGSGKKEYLETEIIQDDTASYE